MLHMWGTQAMTVRANGFSPASEAVGDGAFRMKWLAAELPKLKAQATVLGMCEKGQLSFDKLEEPHKSQAERLSRTTMRAAISAGSGSAVAFVSSWDDHVSIDHIVVNPSYMVLGEEAEVALLEQLTADAVEAGAAEVRLRAAYQVAGDAFYEQCGFFPPEEEEPLAEGEQRVLFYRAGAAAAASSSASADASSSGSSSAPAASAAGGGEAPAAEAFGVAPDGFSWGALY